MVMIIKFLALMLPTLRDMDFKAIRIWSKICAATGNSIIFSHLSAGDSTQKVSGVTDLDRMTINTNGNVGIGVANPI
jgi:hypothetical protein